MKISTKNIKVKEILLQQYKKICSKCKEIKDLTDFCKDKNRKDGYYCECKLCQKQVREKNKSFMIQYSKEYRDKNKKKLSIQKKQYYKDNKKILKQKSKEHRENNLEYYKDYNKEYREKSKNKIRHNKQLNEKYRTDINFKIKVNLRNRITDALKYNRKTGRTLELLGCSIEELKIHLQSQFEPGMAWDNHGLWHIDHKIPCVLFDLSKSEEQRKCFNFKNLQPLWALDNLRKSDKILKVVI